MSEDRKHGWLFWAALIITLDILAVICIWLVGIGLAFLGIWFNDLLGCTPIQDLGTEAVASGLCCLIAAVFALSMIYTIGYIFIGWIKTKRGQNVEATHGT